jgi:hypothetical protein
VHSAHNDNPYTSLQLPPFPFPRYSIHRLPFQFPKQTIPLSLAREDNKKQTASGMDQGVVPGKHVDGLFCCTIVIITRLGLITEEITKKLMTDGDKQR